MYSIVNIQVLRLGGIRSHLIETISVMSSSFQRFDIIMPIKYYG